MSLDLSRTPVGKRYPLTLCPSKLQDRTYIAALIHVSQEEDAYCVGRSLTITEGSLPLPTSSYVPDFGSIILAQTVVVNAAITTSIRKTGPSSH